MITNKSSLHKGIGKGMIYLNMTVFTTKGDFTGEKEGAGTFLEGSPMGHHSTIPLREFA